MTDSVEQGDLYSYVQGVFRRGLVLVVGSGASCAFGLPGMTALASFLIQEAPGRIVGLDQDSVDNWVTLSGLLQQSTDLESAMSSTAVSDSLSDVLGQLIADCVLEAEKAAIDQILNSPTVSAFGRLFSHLLQTAPTLNVITTNYDRLLEVQAARAGVRLDSMFYGHTIGRFDSDLSREELLYPQTPAGRGRTTQFAYRPHVQLSKPHGSLDWFSQGNTHYRSDLDVPGIRRIVPPGGNKYRLGYEVPFDAQRNRANAAIDKASALLFVGYGFNDDHLQTHIQSRVYEVPTVILSRTLTAKAHEYLALNESSVGIEAGDDLSRSRVFRDGVVAELDEPIWDIEHLVQEVLKI